MGRYSIKELEQLSGIKAHTIRIWEKRYAIIEPQRTETNIRYYSDDNLIRIINVALLNANGIKISRIVEMSDHEITQKVLEISESENDNSIHISQLVAAMVNLDEGKFETTLSGFFLRYNFEQTVTEIVYPFLEKTGILWQTKNITPAQEHFISNLIRQKIIVAIDALPLQSGSLKKALLFLPEHELHEIGLLVYHYLVRRAGYKTIYLGQAVPYADLKQVHKIYTPHIMITSLTSPFQDEEPGRWLENLARDFPSSEIYASGLQIRKGEISCPSEKIHLFQDVSTLKQLLDL